MTSQHIARVPSENDAINAIAGSGHDAPVLMLNLNRYTIAAAYPDGEEYLTYLAKIEESVGRVGGNQSFRVSTASNRQRGSVSAAGAMRGQFCDSPLSRRPISPTTLGRHMMLEVEFQELSAWSCS